MSDQGAGRFRDPLVRLGRFAGEVLVRCPACGECATVLAHLGAPEFRAVGGRRVARRRRLPAWLKSAKNRDDVLRLIRRLRPSLPTEPR